MNESASGPVLAGPVPRRGRLPTFEFFRTLRGNMIATFAQESYERDVVERRIFGRHRFIVNEPAAVKHVLLDNAANYRKSEITRRILEPGLGKGLITSEGETWRRQRRTMSPAFDHRRIVAYTPIMSAAAEELLEDWGRLGTADTVEVAQAMMAVTLNIISRTMFSSDSDHSRRHHGARRRPLSGADAPEYHGFSRFAVVAGGPVAESGSPIARSANLMPRSIG